METKTFVWSNRQIDLQKVKRFFDPLHCFNTMYYPTNLSIHTRRTEAMTTTLLPVALECYENFNPRLAQLISRYHDDPELVGKDTSLQLKLQFTPKQQRKAHRDELRDIDTISRLYGNPKIAGYWYKDILLHALNKDIREAQIHSFADKRDGESESLHEVFAGNIVFLEPVMNYMQETFAKREIRFPLIKEMFAPDIAKLNPLLQFPVLDFLQFCKKKVPGPHTQASVSLDTKIPSYELWKKITLSTFGNGVDLLTKQIEFQ